MNTYDFLNELFCDEKGRNEGGPPVVLKTLCEEPNPMHIAAQKFGLESESVWDGSGRRRNRVMVVGQKEDVERVIKEIDERNGRTDMMHWEYARKGEGCREESSEALLEWRSRVWGF